MLATKYDETLSLHRSEADSAERQSRQRDVQPAHSRSTSISRGRRSGRKRRAPSNRNTAQRRQIDEGCWARNSSPRWTWQRCRGWSLNRALAELFKVVREEAASNPTFALKLEEALSVYRPSKALKQAARAQVKPQVEPRPVIAEPVCRGPAPARRGRAGRGLAASSAGGSRCPAMNPVSIYSRQGEDGLRCATGEPDFARGAGRAGGRAQSGSRRPAPRALTATD